MTALDLSTILPELVLAIYALGALMAGAYLGKDAIARPVLWTTVAALLVIWEFMLVRHRDRDACFRAFLHNHWAGLAIFVGIVLDYALR